MLRLSHNLCQQNNYLSDSHGAKDVEKDKGAVSGVISHERTMGQPLQERYRLKWQLSNYQTIKSVWEQSQSVHCLLSHQSNSTTNE